MLRYHMAVVTTDGNLRRAIKRLTTSTGATAEFPTELAKIANDPAPNVVIMDAREKEPTAAMLKALPANARIIYIVDGESTMNKLSLIEDPRVTSLFCHDDRFDDDEFISTATKALRGEVFGVQKYFPWGVTTYSMVVHNHDEKGRAIETLMEYATLAGCRGAVRDRIQLVCDELMMNALYHAPVGPDGKELYAGKTLKELAQMTEVSAIRVQYGCSGRYFGVSVRDSGGSLKRPKLLDYLKRAKSGATIENKVGGAGLGLVSVLKSVSKLVFNLDPGSSTEVVALFDMELFAKGKMGARSLHIFTAANEQRDQRMEDRGPGARRAADAGEETPHVSIFASTRAWAVLCVLVGVLAIFATAVYFKKHSSEAPRQIVIEASEPGTVVKIGGEVVPAGQPVSLPAPVGDEPVKLTVGK